MGAEPPTDQPLLRLLSGQVSSGPTNLVESGGRAPPAIYCAFVSPLVVSVSAIVRRRPASVSDM
jgi:hypothetical protein